MTIIAGLGLSIAAAVIPTSLYTWLIWWCDRYEREPWSLLSAAFIWGALPAIILSLIAELIIDIPLSAFLTDNARDFLSTGIASPIIEETAKGAALLGIFLLARREFDNVLDGIVYGALVGFGFAATENLFYFLSALWQDGWGQWVIVVLLRTVVFGFNHAFFTSLTGIGLGIARLTQRRWLQWGAPIFAFGGAIFAHALHNIGALLASQNVLNFGISLLTDWGGFWVVVAVIILSWRQERGWLREFLADEAIPAADRRALLSARLWERVPVVGHMASVTRPSLRREYHQLLAELAFRKRHLVQQGNADLQLQQEITQLRARLRELQAILQRAT